MVLEKNCKFEPLVHKLGRIKRTVKDMGELMDAVTKYNESNKTKDGDSDKDKAGHGKNPVAKARTMEIRTSKISVGLIRMPKT